MQSFPSRCQHIKVNGTQCGCPALRRNKLCYFHKRHHEERVQLNTDRLKNARRRPATIELPVLEDANSIQVSLMQIMRLLVSGQLEGQTAGLLLYALQTASHNLSRTTFQPRMHDVVLDLRAVDQTPLGDRIWEDSDFEEEADEEALRAEALAEAQRKAKKQAELQRWAEAEANRLIVEGAREREVARKIEAAKLAREAEQERQLEADRVARGVSETWSSTPTVTPAGRAVVPAPEPPPSPGKRPPAKVTISEVREQVREHIRKQAPAMLAAQAAKKNAKKNAGSSG